MAYAKNDNDHFNAEMGPVENEMGLPTLKWPSQKSETTVSVPGSRNGAGKGPSD